MFKNRYFLKALNVIHIKKTCFQVMKFMYFKKVDLIIVEVRVFFYLKVVVNMFGTLALFFLPAIFNL